MKTTHFFKTISLCLLLALMSSCSIFGGGKKTKENKKTQIRRNRSTYLRQLLRQIKLIKDSVLPALHQEICSKNGGLPNQLG